MEAWLKSPGAPAQSGRLSCARPGRRVGGVKAGAAADAALPQASRSSSAGQLQPASRQESEEGGEEQGPLQLEAQGQEQRQAVADGDEAAEPSGLADMPETQVVLPASTAQLAGVARPTQLPQLAATLPATLPATAAMPATLLATAAMPAPLPATAAVAGTSDPAQGGMQQQQAAVDSQLLPTQMVLDLPTTQAVFFPPDAEEDEAEEEQQQHQQQATALPETAPLGSASAAEAAAAAATAAAAAVAGALAAAEAEEQQVCEEATREEAAEEEEEQAAEGMALEEEEQAAEAAAPTAAATAAEDVTEAAAPVPGTAVAEVQVVSAALVASFIPLPSAPPCQPAHAVPASGRSAEAAPEPTGGEPGGDEVAGMEVEATWMMRPPQEADPTAPALPPASAPGVAWAPPPEHGTPAPARAEEESGSESEGSLYSYGYGSSSEEEEGGRAGEERVQPTPLSTFDVLALAQQQERDALLRRGSAKSPSGGELPRGAAVHKGTRCALHESNLHATCTLTIFLASPLHPRAVAGLSLAGCEAEGMSQFQSLHGPAAETQVLRVPPASPALLFPSGSPAACALCPCLTTALHLPHACCAAGDQHAVGPGPAGRRAGGPEERRERRDCAG